MIEIEISNGKVDESRDTAERQDETYLRPNFMMGYSYSFLATSTFLSTR